MLHTLDVGGRNAWNGSERADPEGVDDPPVPILGVTLLIDPLGLDVTESLQEKRALGTLQ